MGVLGCARVHEGVLGCAGVCEGVQGCTRVWVCACRIAMFVDARRAPVTNVSTRTMVDAMYL